MRENRQEYVCVLGVCCTTKEAKKWNVDFILWGEREISDIRGKEKKGILRQKWGNWIEDKNKGKGGGGALMTWCHQG